MLSKFENFILLTQENKIQIGENAKDIPEKILEEAIDTIFYNHNLTEIEIAMENITDQLAFLFAREINIKISNPKVITPDGSLENVQQIVSTVSNTNIIKNPFIESQQNALHDEETVKQKLVQHIPSHYQLGAAIGQGDCFFDAIAQSLNALKDSKEYTAKSLRLLCDDYVKSGEHAWVKGTIEAEGDNYEQYLVRIPFTVEELEEEEKANTGLKLEDIIWGRPEIEGRMICEITKVKLHVIGVLEEPVNGVDVVEQLVDAQAPEPITSIEKGLYDDSDIVHLVNHQNHFVPLLDSKISQIEKPLTQSAEHSRSLSTSFEFTISGKNLSTPFKIIPPKITLSIQNIDYSSTMQRWFTQVVDNYNYFYHHYNFDQYQQKRFLLKTSLVLQDSHLKELPEVVLDLIIGYLKHNPKDLYSFQDTSWGQYLLVRSFYSVENNSIIRNFFYPKNYKSFKDFKKSLNFFGVCSFAFDEHKVNTANINGKILDYIDYDKKEVALDSYVQNHMTLYGYGRQEIFDKPYQIFYDSDSVMLSLRRLENLISTIESGDQQVLSALISMAIYNRKNLPAIRQILTVGSYTGNFLFESQVYPVNINLKNFKFSKRVVIDFSKTSISEEDLSNCYMQRMRIENADLDKIKLRRTKLTKSSLINSFIDEADLTEADLNKSKLDKAKVRRAYLQDANLQGASLFRAKLDFSNLKNANLRNADIRRAKLTGCVLDNADLRGVKGIEQIYKAKSAFNAKMLLTDYYNFFNRNIPTANKLNWFRKNKIEILPDEVTYKYI